MIDEAQRQALADLALRALDAATGEYGEDATLRAAVLVFEVAVHSPSTDEITWHGHWEALHGQSPHYSAGLLREVACRIMDDSEDG